MRFDLPNCAGLDALLDALLYAALRCSTVLYCALLCAQLCSLLYSAVLYCCLVLRLGGGALSPQEEALEAL